MAINDEALDALFRTARTHRAWIDRPVTPTLLMALYDLVRLAPTALNANPMRLIFVTSKEGKEQLKPHLATANVEKTMAAPVTAILGYDLDFPKTMGVLNPHNPKIGETMTDPQANEVFALRNGSMQAGYFILAARSLGLDCGPMSGFNNTGVDGVFFVGTAIKSNILCNLGYGDADKLHPRAPRPSFDEACRFA